MFRALNRVIAFLLVYLILRMALPTIVGLIQEIITNALNITNKALELTDQQFPK